jgi:aminoglycoside phosphotransferase (APT) family kinase protein
MRPLVIYDYMPGEMWNRRRPTRTELAQLAAISLKISELSAGDLWLSRASQPASQAVASFRTTFETYATWVEAEFAPGQQAAELCLSLLERCQAAANELAAYTPPLYFCRADPRFANVIQRPGGRLGLVDWEDSGLCDSARELADLLTHPNQEDLLSWSEWQAFLQPYTAVRTQTDPHLLDRFRLYLALFPVFWLSILLDAGLRRLKQDQGRIWFIDGFPANEKLRRYLARGLAWPEPDFSSHLEALATVTFFPYDA